MNELTNYLPLRVMRFPNTDAADTDVEKVVLAEIVSFDDEMTEIAFNIGRKRYYLAIRQADVAMLSPPSELSKEPGHEGG